MVSPVRMHLQNTKRGLYETFDFRGVSADGRYAFTLKHSVCKPWLAQGLVEVAMICYDRKTAKTYCIAEQEELSVSHQKQLKNAEHWENCTFSFASGSFFEISRNTIRGKLHTAQGSVSWSLSLQRRDEVLHQFPQELCYQLPWPRYKVQMRDCFLKFEGKIQFADFALAGELFGTNHHYWGDGYPYEYAAAQCNRFIEDPGAFFYGFSTRLNVGKFFKTPYLSMASLKLRGRWYNFNEVKYSFRHSLEALDNYRWRISYMNGDYGLDVEVNGSNPRMAPWAGWHVEQPLGERAVVKSTAFAKAVMTLYKRGSMEVIAELSSDAVELKTLLPENLAEGQGFWVAP
jgi:hypothetical protein